MEPLLAAGEAARILGISKVTLQRMRSAGTGPRYVLLGQRRIAYRSTDILDWLNAQTVVSTADQGQRK